MSKALENIKVLDLTQFESGTVCTETLAWLGADVIKVERPETGEQARFSHAEPGIDSYGFILVNLNKKSVTLNIKSEEGKEILRRLIKKCDVMIENMAPGAIERLGFGYEEVSKLNPQLIYAQIKGFGRGSPWEKYAAFDPVAQAMGGAASLTGEPDGLPTQSGVDMADSGAGLNTALAIVAALYQRTHTGRGQRVEVAMQDTVIALSRASYEPQLRNGRPSPRVGNGMVLENVAPVGKYPCRPGGPNDYVHLAPSRAPGSKQWDNLCQVIGRPDLLEDPRFATPQSRYNYREEIDAAIIQWSMQRTKEEAMREMGAVGVPAGMVLSTEDILNDEYLNRHGIIAEIDHPQRGKLKVPGFAPRMSDNQVEITTAPSLGEHNNEIYRDFLGLSEDTLAEFREKKII